MTQDAAKSNLHCLIPHPSLLSQETKAYVSVPVAHEAYRLAGDPSRGNKTQSAPVLCQEMIYYSISIGPHLSEEPWDGQDPGIQLKLLTKLV